MIYPNKGGKDKLISIVGSKPCFALPISQRIDMLNLVLGVLLLLAQQSEAARNQQALYPERTVRSIKRRMGGQETVTLSGKEFTPQEVSALILHELAEWGMARLASARRRP
jgi:hypothetical protein